MLAVARLAAVSGRQRFSWFNPVGWSDIYAYLSRHRGTAVSYALRNMRMSGKLELVRVPHFSFARIGTCIELPGQGAPTALNAAKQSQTIQKIRQGKVGDGLKHKVPRLPISAPPA